MRAFELFLLASGVLTAVCTRGITEEHPLTVQEAVTQALGTDPAVAADAELASAAESARMSRRLDRLPDLSLSTGYTRLNQADPIPITGTTPPANVYGISAELRQPLFSGGRLSELVRGADLEAEAARFQAEATRLELRLRVVRTYWQTQRHTAAVAALEERKTQVEELLKELESRFDQGVATLEEILRVRGILADTGLRLARSRSARDLAAMELGLLTGVPEGVTIIPVSELPEDFPPLPDREMLWRKAQEGHPQLAAAKLRTEAAGSAERVSRAGLYPTVALNGSWGYQSPDSRAFPPEEEITQFWQLGVVLHFDLLSPVRVPIHVQEAASRRLATVYKRQDVENQLYLSLNRAYMDAQLAEREVEAAGTQQEYARELYRAVKDRYDQGTALRSELIDAQAVVLETGLRLIDARVSRTVSRAALNAIVGAEEAESWAVPSGFGGVTP
jgi:outer membrane protein TolC